MMLFFFFLSVHLVEQKNEYDGNCSLFKIICASKVHFEVSITKCNYKSQNILEKRVSGTKYHLD